MRKINKITDSKFLDEYLKNQENSVNNFCEKIENYNQITDKEINEIKSDDILKNNINRTFEKYWAKWNSDTTRELPIKQIEKAFDLLEGIDSNIFKKNTLEEKNKLDTSLNQIIDLISILKNKLNDE